MRRDESNVGPKVGIPLVVYHISQDDPKKNTARKLARFGHCTLVDRVAQVPRGAILLDPFSERALSREDEATARKRGVVALDCSWKLAEEVFPEVRGRTEPRALPALLACNPVNYGKWGQLSTAEALAASCAILGEKAQCDLLMTKFGWGHTFVETNAEPLADYAAAATSKDVVAAQFQYVPRE